MTNPSNPVSPQVFVSNSEAETFAFAKALEESLPSTAHVLLYRELGARKTAFTRGLCAGFGIDDPEEVASPTFTLINQYHGRTPIYHIDLYRIETGVLDSLGLDDIFDDPAAAVIVEWAERLGRSEPKGVVKVFLEYVNAESRKIDVCLPSL